MVTPDEFRSLALALPEVEELEHMGHPDFRVAGKNFAALDYPERGWGMVDLIPEQQTDFMEIQPDGFSPARGGWGKNGSTLVRLSGVSEKLISAALCAAWSKRAPARLIKTFDP